MQVEAAAEAGGGGFSDKGSDSTGPAPPYYWDTDPQTNTAQLFVSPDNGRVCLDPGRSRAEAFHSLRWRTG